MKQTAILSLFLILLLSCSGGYSVRNDISATSASWTGKAKIVSIGRAGESASGNRDYLEVRFDFIPDSASCVMDYLAGDVPDSNNLLFYDNRSDLHKNWIDKWGLKTGNEYRAVRYENTQNSPGNRVVFEVYLEPR